MRGARTSPMRSSNHSWGGPHARRRLVLDPHSKDFQNLMSPVFCVPGFQVTLAAVKDSSFVFSSEVDLRSFQQLQRNVPSILGFRQGWVQNQTSDLVEGAPAPRVLGPRRQRPVVTAAHLPRAAELTTLLPRGGWGVLLERQSSVPGPLPRA